MTNKINDLIDKIEKDVKNMGKTIVKLEDENYVLRYRLQRALVSLSSHDSKLADFIEICMPE